MVGRTVPNQTCPGCSAKLEAATHAGPGSPSPNPGDISVCLYCQMPLRFNDELRLEPLDLEKLALENPESDEEVKRVVLTMKMMESTGRMRVPKGK